MRTLILLFVCLYSALSLAVAPTSASYVLAPICVGGGCYEGDENDRGLGDGPNHSDSYSDYLLSETDRILNGDFSERVNQKDISNFIENLDRRLNSGESLRDYSATSIEKAINIVNAANETEKNDLQTQIQSLKSEIESELHSNIDVTQDFISTHNQEINHFIATLPYLDSIQAAENFKSSSLKVRETALYSNFVSKTAKAEDLFLKEAADRMIKKADKLSASGNFEASEKAIAQANKLLDNALSPNSVSSVEWKSNGEARIELDDLHKKVSKVRPSSPDQALGKNLALASLDEADEAFANGDNDLYEKNLELAKAGLDIALGFIPIANVGQSLYEAITGRSVITGEELGTFGQAMAILGVATLGATKTFQASLKAIGRIGETALRTASEASRNGFKGAFSLSTKVLVSSEKLFTREGFLNFLDIIKNEKGSFSLFPENITNAIESIKYPNLWSEGKYKDSIKNAISHYEKHGKEFPEIKNAFEYVEKAHQFINNPPRGTLIKIRQNGDKISYCQSSETFVVQAVDGAPKTMFIPNPKIHGYPTNLEYFNAQ